MTAEFRDILTILEFHYVFSAGVTVIVIWALEQIKSDSRIKSFCLVLPFTAQLLFPMFKLGGEMADSMRDPKLLQLEELFLMALHLFGLAFVLVVFAIAIFVKRSRDIRAF